MCVVLGTTMASACDFRYIYSYVPQGNASTLTLYHHREAHMKEEYTILYNFRFIKPNAYKNI
jgi:hypothetical protein